jgi:CBS domain containing-hemolysin-like protein
MEISLWLVFLVVVLWSAAYVLHAVRFSVGGLSPFELKRRIDTGDVVAAQAGVREELLPRLRTLQQLVEAVVTVLAIAVTISTFDWILGTAFAAGLCLLRERASRLPMFRAGANRLRETYEPVWVEALGSWHWLDKLQGATDVSADRAAGSREELYHIIDASSSLLGVEERHRLAASEQFDTKTVLDVMTPISVVDTVDVSDSLGPLVLDELHKTGHSRFPVVDKDVHHVVGILYLHDIINLKSAKATVKESMDGRVHYIHENQTLEHALNGFLKSHRHLFVVVNDYRETVGVLTLEDVIEALLGRTIVDEFDRYDDLRAVAESNPRKNNLPKGKTDI